MSETDSAQNAARGIIRFTIIAAKFGLVAGLLIAAFAYYSARKLGSKSSAKSNAAQLTMAIANFYSDHTAYPILSPYADHVGIVDSELVNALTGNNPIINPDNTVYISPHPKYISPDNAFLDPWGKPYHVHIDTTFNHRITNPQPDTGTPELYHNALIYSAGPDQDPATWHDNITSWQ